MTCLVAAANSERTFVSPDPPFLSALSWFLHSVNSEKWSFKGTGTRDLIWLKVVSLDRSWLVGLTDGH